MKKQIVFEEAEFADLRSQIICHIIEANAGRYKLVSTKTGKDIKRHTLIDFIVRAIDCVWPT